MSTLDELSPREDARIRRRDRDAQAAARAGMRTGLAKTFKTILDLHVRRAEEGSTKQKRGRRPVD